MQLLAAALAMLDHLNLVQAAAAAVAAQMPPTITATGALAAHPATSQGAPQGRTPGL